MGATIWIYFEVANTYDKAPQKHLVITSNYINNKIIIYSWKTSGTN